MHELVLWRREGFKVPPKQRKKRRLGNSGSSVARHQPRHKGHVWCRDFIHDRDEAGRPLKWFALTDEYTRERLALEVARRMTTADVIDILSQVLLVRCLSKFIRSDNGPEFIARAVRDYQEKAGVGRLYIAPEGPWEKGYAESFFSRLHDALPDAELLVHRREARGLAVAWQSEYNHRGPHSASGYQTPAAFAGMCAQADATPRSMAAAAVGGCGQSVGAHGQPSAAAALGLRPWTPVSSPPERKGMETGNQACDSHNDWYIKRGQVTFTWIAHALLSSPRLKVY